MVVVGTSIWLAIKYIQINVCTNDNESMDLMVHTHTHHSIPLDHEVHRQKKVHVNDIYLSIYDFDGEKRKPNGLKNQKKSQRPREPRKRE